MNVTISSFISHNAYHIISSSINHHTTHKLMRRTKSVYCVLVVTSLEGIVVETASLSLEISRWQNVWEICIWTGS